MPIPGQPHTSCVFPDCDSASLTNIIIIIIISITNSTIVTIGIISD